MGKASVQEAVDLAGSVERLRLAEAKLARRRSTQTGVSESDRAAMRFILESADAGSPCTPGAIATQLHLSPAAVTALIDRLLAAGLVRLEPNPRDRRSKLVLPFDRAVDPDKFDPLTARIRDMARELTGRDAHLVARFLDRVAEAVSSTTPARPEDTD